ncbi:hypothetical protein L6452_08031 [Arctium lappa]|uniref:Uncharacterized protein n=1 Tax=Arctium lappa TaxID=4217 RepID=A0ACB9DGS7_ARCLA|nr:hypothetical protein L6452_08031 [Arctium lappa]
MDASTSPAAMFIDFKSFPACGYTLKSIDEVDNLPQSPTPAFVDYAPLIDTVDITLALFMGVAATYNHDTQIFEYCSGSLKPLWRRMRKLMLSCSQTIQTSWNDQEKLETPFSKEKVVAETKIMYEVERKFLFLENVLR